MTSPFRVVRLLALFGLAVTTLSCSSGGATAIDPPDTYCLINSAEVEERIDALLDTLTLGEKASLMHGISIVPVDGTWQSTSLPDKGIPGFHMLDGPKGVGGSATLPVANGSKTTAFPVPVARSATWNRELERRVGAAIALEARAVGADTLLAPGMNLAWHPLSGRNQEYYGEDPFLAGEIGVAFVQGVQGMGVIATAKHFTANHIEDTRLDVNAIIDERTLRENFLPQFRKVVQKGAVGSVMSAYNQLNGAYCAENSPLLGEILKNEWGFPGFVMSDFLWGTYNTVPSALAGLDVEMQNSRIYGEPIVRAVDDGELELSNVDEHVRRILRAQLCYELDSNPAVPDESKLETDETIALAREVATQSITLLRNQADFLPLSKSRAESIVLVGPLADVENIGDTKGSSGVMSSEVVTIAEGLLARTDVASTIEFIPGDLMDADDRAKVTAADVVIVAVGLTDEDEGEGQVRAPLTALGAGDRETYGLPEDDAAFLTSVLALNEDIVIVLEGGSAIDLSPWFEGTRAVVMAWYPGVQGGHAVADVLFGDTSPSGRLPVSFPRTLSDLQPFPDEALEVAYESYHGYQRLDRNGVSPFLPFGFGLSYTTFEYSALTAEWQTEDRAEIIRLTFTLSNTGARAGIETAQVYAGTVDSAVDRPVRKLVGFAQASLEAGESTTVQVSVPVRELAYYEVGTGWVVEPGAYTLEVGPNVANLALSAELTRP
ncbi:MAG: glycoside hydrolase family 3 C-terminal domain-containing protein [Myxococcales bacterium]|nr:glycoside hydrolase family 3 C-terminal domain-containing protein [Myxococcales bacterium]